MNEKTTSKKWKNKKLKLKTIDKFISRLEKAIKISELEELPKIIEKGNIKIEKERLETFNL